MEWKERESAPCLKLIPGSKRWCMSLIAPADRSLQVETQTECVWRNSRRLKKRYFLQHSLTSGQKYKTRSICRIGTLLFCAFLLEAYTNWKPLRVGVKRAGKGKAFPYGPWHLERRWWVFPFSFEGGGRGQVSGGIQFFVIEGQSILFFLPDLLVFNPSWAQRW